MSRIGFWGLACAGLSVFVGTAAWAQAPAKPDAPKADPGVAATIGGKPVTYQELDAKALKTDMKLAQSLYDARRNALDQVLMERLLGEEAAAQKTTVDELIKKKVAEKAKPVTDADVEAFFNANSARMGGKTLEQVSAQIKNQLTSQKQNEARNNLLAELKGKADVKVSLEPPRAEVVVAANDPIKGPKDAKVTILEYSEFQCPFCARVGPTMKQITDTYGDKVRIVWRDYPLPMHNRAKPAAEAAQCANEQGKFWDYHDKLFANQQAMTDDDFKKHATDLGLNVESFMACLSSGKFRADVEKDTTEGSKSGVTGTPAFFVNGRFLSGAQPFEAFKAMIDDELKK